MVRARSYARYVCRTYGAAQVEFLRYTHEPLPADPCSKTTSRRRRTVLRTLESALGNSGEGRLVHLRWLYAKVIASFSGPLPQALTTMEPSDWDEYILGGVRP